MSHQRFLDWRRRTGLQEDDVARAIGICPRRVRYYTAGTPVPPLVAAALYAYEHGWRVGHDQLLDAKTPDGVNPMWKAPAKVKGPAPGRQVKHGQNWLAKQRAGRESLEFTAPFRSLTRRRKRP